MTTRPLKSYAADFDSMVRAFSMPQLSVDVLGFNPNVGGKIVAFLLKFQLSYDCKFLFIK